MLDRRARRYLGIGGAEFLRRWQDGYYASDLDGPGVQEVAALLPFVEPAAPDDPLAAKDSAE